MGIMANMAARSEMKNRDQILAYIREFNPQAQVGPVPMPCHIITETHNGIFAIDKTGGRMGFYRCQGFWWGREISAEQHRGLLSPDSLRWMAAIAAADPNPNAVAPLSVGLMGLAAGIAASI